MASPNSITAQDSIALENAARVVRELVDIHDRQSQLVIQAVSAQKECSRFLATLELAKRHSNERLIHGYVDNARLNLGNLNRLLQKLEALKREEDTELSAAVASLRQVVNSEQRKRKELDDQVKRIKVSISQINEFIENAFRQQSPKVDDSTA